MLHLLGEEAPKIEYIRTISIALLTWMPWMNKLQACSFLEESCEALLSRVAHRCNVHRHVSTFEGVVDLYLTVPPAKNTARNTRGTLRAGLLHLLLARVRKILHRSSELQFVEWGPKKGTMYPRIPPSFSFPKQFDNVDEERVKAVAWQ